MKIFVDEMRDLQTALSNDAQCIHLHTNEDNEQCSPAGKRKADNAAGSSADHAKRRRRVTVAANA